MAPLILSSHGDGLGQQGIASVAANEGLNFCGDGFLLSLSGWVGNPHSFDEVVTASICLALVPVPEEEEGPTRRKSRISADCGIVLALRVAPFNSRGPIARGVSSLSIPRAGSLQWLRVVSSWFEPLCLNWPVICNNNSAPA